MGSRVLEREPTSRQKINCNLHVEDIRFLRKSMESASCQSCSLKIDEIDVNATLIDILCTLTMNNDFHWKPWVVK